MANTRVTLLKEFFVSTGAGPFVLTAVPLTKGQLTFIGVPVSGGQCPSVTSPSATWQPVESMNKGDVPDFNQGILSVLCCIPSATATEDVTISVFNQPAAGMAAKIVGYSAGYTYITQTRLISVNHPVSEGGNAGTMTTTGHARLWQAPTSGHISFIFFDGNATNVAPTAASDGVAVGVQQSGGTGTPKGVHCMAEDTGKQAASWTWTTAVVHQICTIEVTSTPTNLKVVCGLHMHHEKLEAANNTISSASLRVGAGRTVVVLASVNAATTPEVPGAIPISDTSGATWAQIVAGGQVDGVNGYSRTHGWSAHFPNATTTTVTCGVVPGTTAGNTRMRLSVFSVLGPASGAAIRRADKIAGAGAALSIELAGAQTAGDLGILCAARIGAVGMVQGTGEMEFIEFATGGTNPQDLQVLMNLTGDPYDNANLGGLPGTAIAFDLQLGAVVFPAQAAGAVAGASMGMLSLW